MSIVSVPSLYRGRRHSVAVPLIPPPDGETFEGGYRIERNPITGGARLIPPPPGTGIFTHTYSSETHRKKSFSIFPSPAKMSLTKLCLGGNNLYKTSLFPPRKSWVSDIPAGDGNIDKLFLRCTDTYFTQICIGMHARILRGKMVKECDETPEGS
jgi:hypothetical protein